MLALLTILVLFPLLYLPGWSIALALLGSAQPTDPLERHYERVLFGALLNGWLVLLLASLGLFSLWLHLLLIIVATAAGLLLAHRRGDLVLPRAPLGIVARPFSRGAQAQPNAAAWVRQHSATLGFAAVLVVFALLVARPFEVVLGVRDAGVYANIGFAIANTGSIVIDDPVVAQIGQDQHASDESLRKAAEQAETNFLGSQHPHRHIATRLRAAGFYVNEGELAEGRVVPQFFHLFPAWIGLLTALLGMHGGLLATSLMGWLGVWSVGMLGRRLAGTAVGVIGMLLLALNGVQVWFSRYSTSEATVQFLGFAGLYAFAVMVSERNHSHNTQPGRLDRASVAALLAGLAFGQVALSRIDFVLIVGPALAYLGYIWLTRRWARIHTWMSVGLGAMLVHAALHVVFIARAYFFDTLSARLQDFALTALISLPFLPPTLQTYWLSKAGSRIGIRLGPGEYLWNWRRITIEIVAVVLLCVGIWALRRWGQPLLAWFERQVQRWSRVLLIGSAALIVALAVYGYLIRPQILSWQRLAELPSCLASGQISAPGSACLALQGYIGAPIVVPEHINQVAYAFRVLPTLLKGQPLPPIESLLFVEGNADASEKFALVQANFVRVGWYVSPLGVLLAVVGFVLWWRRGLNGASWLFLALGLVATVFFVRQSYGTTDQSYIYILRRYVPLVYPTMSLAMAYALVLLAEARPWATWLSRARIGAAALMLVALVGFSVLTNRTIYRHVEYDGALDQLSIIAAQFNDDDVLLFHSGSRDEPDLLATPLKFAFERNAFTIKSTNPENYAEPIARYIRHWQEQGHSVYLIFGPSGGFSLPGLTLTPTGRMGLQHLQEFEQLTNQKPHNIQDFNLDFAVYRVEGEGVAPEPIAQTYAPDAYAAQAYGFYRAEQIGGVQLAWTQSEALLRLPWPQDGAPITAVLQLAGGKRPATLGPAQVCLAFWPEVKGFAAPEQVPGDLGCFELDEQMGEVRVTLDPSLYGITEANGLLLQLRSTPWVPAKVDPAQVDQRSLGVQFGGVRLESAQP